MRAATEETYRERILRVQMFVQENLARAVDVAELASVANFSPHHFHRVFRGMVGEPLHGYVRRLRLERAAQLLKRTDESVVQVALSVGYEAHESFTRAFSATFGCSPSAFREAKSQAAAGVDAGDAERDLNPIAGSGGAALDVSVESLDEMPVVFVRHVGAYDEVGPAWAKVFALAGAAGLLGPTMQFFGVPHDDPDVTPRERLRYDACIRTRPGVMPSGELGVAMIPGGEYATVRHIGPYSELGGVYLRLCSEWFPRSGRDPGFSPALEFYRNHPDRVPPEELITDIFMPLA